MPSRSFTVVIVVSWLLTTSWLVWSDVLPRLLPGTPPPFAVLLVEEADQQRPPTRWTASRNGENVFAAQSRLMRVGHEQYELTAVYTPYGVTKAQAKPQAYVPLGAFLVSRMVSAYRVNAEGDFLGLDVVIEAKLALGGQNPWIVGDFTARIAGDAKGGVLQPVLTVQTNGIVRPPVSMGEIVGPRRGGAVLMPLHPVNRVTGLRPGQRWTLPLFDPVAGMQTVGVGLDYVPPLLRASVRPEPVALQRGLRKPEPCFVIDYRGDNLEAATWVRQKDGLVLKQTAKMDRDAWEIVRD